MKLKCPYCGEEEIYAFESAGEVAGMACGNLKCAAEWDPQGKPDRIPVSHQSQPDTTTPAEPSPDPDRWADLHNPEVRR